MPAELTSVVAAIPPPGDWGRQYRLYGIMIALGVLAALELGRRRWQARGGDPEDMSALALWVVPAGLIGARLYHVITDNQDYRNHWFDNPFDPDARSPLAIWKGGLGIPGGLMLGVLVGALFVRRRGMRLPVAADVLAPAIPLAQAIGRWGNYFNQEIFGSPTTLPWGLTVDDSAAFATLGADYQPNQTYHPTFLYESLWNLALMAFLILLDRKRVVRPGRLFFLYIGGYFLGRLWVEALRTDKANTIMGLRVNTWMSLLAIAAVAIILAIIGLRRRPGDSDEPYKDGHRWDPEHGIIAAGAVAGTAGGAGFAEASGVDDGGLATATEPTGSVGVATEPTRSVGVTPDTPSEDGAPVPVEPPDAEEVARSSAHGDPSPPPPPPPPPAPEAPDPRNAPIDESP